jgi:hypothetical protein
MYGIIPLGWFAAILFWEILGEVLAEFIEYCESSNILRSLYPFLKGSSCSSFG